MISLQLRAAGTVFLLCIATGVAEADCTCRAGGRDFVLGATTCLPTPSGSRVATCRMVLNNTSWRFSATPCPAADAVSPRLRAFETAAQSAVAVSAVETAP